MLVGVNYNKIKDLILKINPLVRKAVFLVSDHIVSYGF